MRRQPPGPTLPSTPFPYTLLFRSMELLTAELPGGYSVAWQGISYQERLSGSQAPLLYALSVLIVFLCLAALYESWSIPFSVILAVPVGVGGALAAAYLFGPSNDVYLDRKSGV